MERFILLAQATNLDLKRFQFQQSAGGLSNQLPFFIILGVVLVALSVGIVFYLRRRWRLAEMNEQREEARLRLMLSELNLGDAELEQIKTIAESETPSELMPLLESRAAFEEAVSGFRANHPGHPVLRRTAHLRQRLNYGFNNIRNPFVDTRMLSPGVKMRCILKLPKRELQFVTTVLALSEDHLYVRPPIAKGKPASLGNLRQLDFRVSRENDAEYEFTCRMLGQTPNEMKAVQLEHSHNINRLLFRNAERVDVEIDTQFYVIRQEFLGDKVGPRKAQDSQYMFRGTIKDLSIGGALVLAETPLRQLNDGDMIVFKLPEAQIKEDLAGLVVGGFPRGEQHAQVHLQFLGLKELNRLKLSKYLETLRTPPPTPDQAPGPSAPAPT